MAGALSVAEAEQFLVHEARLLDEGRYNEWLGLFTEDAWYWVPSEPGQDSPLTTVSLIYDDRRLMETRVRRLANPHMHAQQPSARTSRMVANITLETADATQTVRSKLLMVEFRRDKQRVFAGTCFHRLVRIGEGLQIAGKRVDLVNCDGVLEGLVVPF